MAHRASPTPVELIITISNKLKRFIHTRYINLGRMFFNRKSPGLHKYLINPDRFQSSNV